jgi:hypothetical protein
MSTQYHAHFLQHVRPDGRWRVQVVRSSKGGDRRSSLN